jgi:LPXTG-site transpeptidase (sortase) family protein
VAQLGVGAALAAAALVLAGCAPSAGVAGEPVVAGPRIVRPSGPASPAPPDKISRAREGRPAASTRIHFRPDELVLPGGDRAEVKPAATVDGELVVPDNVRHLGWWDGGAFAGDPFGSTVIAGHVDSREQGLGFFVRLLHIGLGDRVVVRGDGHTATYRVTAVRTISKEALAADGNPFDQSSDHRLVLITCTGNYRPDRGGYDSNLVIFAKPVGKVR